MNLNPMQMMSQLNQLKKMVNGDPKEFIDKMLENGQITQEQLDNAIDQAQQFSNLARVNL